MTSPTPPRAARLRLSILLLLLVLISGGVMRLHARPMRTAIIPVGLPTHVAIGLRAGDASGTLQGWMPASGVPWDYAWTYLPGSAWKTWGRAGTFPLHYALEAHAHGYIPVFDFYEQPPGGKRVVYPAMNDAAFMRAYFADVALVMRRLGPGTYDGIRGYGRPAIVHIEPDLSGFVEQSLLSGYCDGYRYCTSARNTPSTFTMAVARSGYPATAPYPNTFQGYNWALLHIRDLYAPNVVMAFNVSPWATRTDISASPDPTVDATALGHEAGQFAAASGFTGLPPGVSPYGLVFEDPADHDSSVTQVWWDRYNRIFPNFHRWEDYLRALHDTTGAYVMPWQVPTGNQYYDTEDNSGGHTQDNRPEYIFGHISELAHAGVIGVLFGQGPGNSVYYDQRQDGITNPAPIRSYECDRCNNHVARYSDDDGGYMRLAARRYYARGAYRVTGV